MMSTEYLPQVTTGALFGAALTASGVFIPSVITKQLELQNFYMLQVFGAAVGSGALFMLALERFGVMQRPVRPNSPLGSQWTYGGNLLGGALVGLGMSLTGACPGTILIQLAQGIQSARPAAIGALLGGMTFSYVSPMLLPRLRPQHSPITKKTLSQAAHSSDLMTYASLITIILGLLAITQKWLHASGPWSSLGGVAIGAVQAVSLLLTSAPLGVSTAYEDGGRYLLQVLHIDKASRPSRVPKTIVFAASMMAGSAALSTAVKTANISSFGRVSITFWQAIVGGFVMVFGARLAGGCTSGHGLSGMSALSVSSFVTLLGMFGAGILSSLLLK